MSLLKGILDKAAFGAVRHDWTQVEALALIEAPFNDLMFTAQTAHRLAFDANAIQKSRLISIKTGGCAENCGYCSQSAHHDTGLKATKLLAIEETLAGARAAKASGATRFCMGAAWSSPKPRDMPALIAMVEGVKALGLETCMTLGQLDRAQAQTLAEAGLDYYNHNIDTSEAHYSKVTTTHTFADRLETLDHVRDAGIKVCCGGILGLGESVADRAAMLVTLANLPAHPDSVPINQLIPIPGTPLADGTAVDAFAFVRTIAAARLMMPRSIVRLSAGRSVMSEELQALCFLAGANSIFVGDRLLTAGNPDEDADGALFDKLGLKAAPPKCEAHAQGPRVAAAACDHDEAVGA
jgi:biotin synthase